MPWSEGEVIQNMHMATLVSTVVPLYRGVVIWYNIFLKKVDLEFVRARDPAMPKVLIGYEGDYPAS